MTTDDKRLAQLAITTTALHWARARAQVLVRMTTDDKRLSHEQIITEVRTLSTLAQLAITTTDSRKRLDYLQALLADSIKLLRRLGDTP